VALLGSVALYERAYVAAAIAFFALVAAGVAVVLPHGVVDRLLGSRIRLTRSGRFVVIILSAILFLIAGPLVGLILISPILILWPTAIVVAYVQGGSTALITGVLNGIAVVAFHRYLTRANILPISLALGGTLGVLAFLSVLSIRGESICHPGPCFSGDSFWMFVVMPAGAGAFCAQLFNRWVLRSIPRVSEEESNNALERERGR
jgi:hypothetical protein